MFPTVTAPHCLSSLFPVAALGKGQGGEAFGQHLLSPYCVLNPSLPGATWWENENGELVSWLREVG